MVKRDDILGKVNLKYHAPKNWEKQIRPQELRRCIIHGTQTGVLVVRGDIRNSSLIMKEAISPTAFAEIMGKFVRSIKDDGLRNNAWYDKFTGDGFLVYWVYSLKKKDPIEEPIEELVEFCHSILNWFPKVVNDFRRNSKNFPLDVGLSIGIDSGQCSLVNIAGELTVVGPPVVGAQRMVDAAKPYQILCNTFLGSKLYEMRHQLAKSEIFISKLDSATKEYPLGQETFSIQLKKVLMKVPEPVDSRKSESNLSTI